MYYKQQFNFAAGPGGVKLKGPENLFSNLSISNGALNEPIIISQT